MIASVEFPNPDNVTPFEASFREEDSSFIASFGEDAFTFTAVFGEIYKTYEDVPPYEGEYEVTPKLVKQTLPTAQKFLARDTVIEEIPIVKVSNSSGGNTMIIG